MGGSPYWPATSASHVQAGADAGIRQDRQVALDGVGDGRIEVLAQARPAHKRAELTSLLFVVAYLAISVPVVSLGVAVEYLGLRTAGLLFTGLIILLTATALVTLAGKRRAGTQRR